MIGLDFETYSECDLRTHGAPRYFEHPSTRALIASIATDEGVRTFDFTTAFGNDPVLNRKWFRDTIRGQRMAAHNASFEAMCLQLLGWDQPISPHEALVDSAVISRARGAGSKLEVAGPQLLGIDKIEQGKDLIKLFSIPRKDGSALIDDQVAMLDHRQDWEDFKRYCEMDARISHDIAAGFDLRMPYESTYRILTEQMNDVGWFVDRDLLDWMSRQFEANKEDALIDFRDKHDLNGSLNLGSTQQLRAWCKERGVNAKSFDRESVEKMLATVTNRIHTGKVPKNRAGDYRAIQDLLRTKQILGGAALLKLETIRNQLSKDGRLRGQYLHIGAGQTWRTSGRGVQMQNLKRLSDGIADVESWLDNCADDVTNEDMAAQMRQLFMAEHPGGSIIVGDFSSVESRGLAYLAGEEWKLNAYRHGQDLYKVLASKMFNVEYGSVTKDQRKDGKGVELGCGYGAGVNGASVFFKGQDKTEDEILGLISDWRALNPKIVALWSTLDGMIHEVARPGGRASIRRFIGNGLSVRMFRVLTPDSLIRQNPQANTIDMVLIDEAGIEIMRRTFQGCYMINDRVHYYKPSELKGGKLWLAEGVNPKTKQRYKFSLYGGKIAGILTQSMCRELFFHVLLNLSHVVDNCYQLKIIGQFHDEIAVEYSPAGDMTLEQAVHLIKQHMEFQTLLPGFPLAAEVHAAQRYIK